MNPNFEFSELAYEFNSLGVVLNGCGTRIYELRECVQLSLTSGETKKGLRYLSGVLVMPHITPYLMVYARKVKITVGQTGISCYLGRNGGFYLEGIPSGEHPLTLEFDRRREIKTTHEKRRMQKNRVRREQRKKFQRDRRRFPQEAQ